MVTTMFGLTPIVCSLVPRLHGIEANEAPPHESAPRLSFEGAIAFARGAEPSVRTLRYKPRTHPPAHRPPSPRPRFRNRTSGCRALGSHLFAARRGPASTGDRLGEPASSAVASSVRRFHMDGPPSSSMLRGPRCAVRCPSAAPLRGVRSTTDAPDPITSCLRRAIVNR
jgi:hypothetical protein